MSYPGTVALLVCSLAIVMVALVTPCINAGLRDHERVRFPRWAFISALGLLGLAVFHLRTSGTGPKQIIQALVLTFTLLAGVFGKWVMETVAQRKPVLHESTLSATLIAASLTVALGSIYTGQLSPSNLVLWCLTGYAWHALFSDCERMFKKNPTVLRRREGGVVWSQTTGNLRE